jgi:putative transposase
VVIYAYNHHVRLLSPEPEVVDKPQSTRVKEPTLLRSSSNPHSRHCYATHALFNLSKLAVWWLRLGIGIERIQPGHPQQNGRHERMHLTLKKEATKPAAANFLQQQARFDKFIDVYNTERPHEALAMKCPAEIYQASPRPYQGLPDIDYPFHDRTIVVTHCGRICLGKKKINFSQVFAGQAVGIKEVQDDIWLVSFMDYDLGYFDLETRVLEPLDNPFGPKMLPM